MKFINSENPKCNSLIGYITATEKELKDFDRVMDFVLDTYGQLDEAELFVVLYNIYLRDSDTIIIEEER